MDKYTILYGTVVALQFHSLYNTCNSALSTSHWALSISNLDHSCWM